MSSTPDGFGDFLKQIERFNHVSDEDVTTLMLRLADAIKQERPYLDGVPPIVRRLRDATDIHATGTQRALVLWDALSEVRAAYKAYRTTTNSRIWDYVVAQAHERYPDRVTAADIVAYDGRMHVTTSSPPPTYRPYQESWRRRAGEWCLHKVLKALHIGGNSLD